MSRCLRVLEESCPGFEYDFNDGNHQLPVEILYINQHLDSASNQVKITTIPGLTLHQPKHY